MTSEDTQFGNMTVDGMRYEHIKTAEINTSTGISSYTLINWDIASWK